VTKSWKSHCHADQLVALLLSWQAEVLRASLLLGSCEEVPPQTLSPL